MKDYKFNQIIYLPLRLEFYKRNQPVLMALFANHLERRTWFQVKCIFRETVKWLQIFQRKTCLVCKVFDLLFLGHRMLQILLKLAPFY